VGCPIRKPLDHPVPARPQSLSWRGHVLPRQQAPRHPPCAHRRGSRTRTAPRSPPGPVSGPAAKARASAAASVFPPHPTPPRAPRSPGGGPRGGVLVSSSLPPAPDPGTDSCCEQWSRGESNPGPPPCKGGALPAKLRPPAAPGLPGWARLDSNQGPRSYQDRALTRLSYAPAPAQAAPWGVLRRRRSSVGRERSPAPERARPRCAPGPPVTRPPVHRPPRRPSRSLTTRDLTTLGCP
jgi:hypothetical protein